MEEKQNELQDALLTEEGIKTTVDEIKEEVIKEHGLDEKQAELFMKMLEEANMPVKMTDADFKLGAQELDIRSLNKKNLTQMMFRSLVLSNVYNKHVLSSLVDIMRLIMVIADKMGVENIVKATDEIIEKTKKQNNFNIEADLKSNNNNNA